MHKLKVALKELKETRVWLRFAGKLLRDPFIEEIEAELACKLSIQDDLI